MKIKIIVLSLSFLLCGAVLAQVSGFPDVKSDQWFYQYINQIKDWNVVNGNDDGTFAPERNINRAEFSKMLVRYDERVSQKIEAAVSSIDVEDEAVEETKNLPSVMHLDRRNAVPKNCPEDWTEIQYGRIYENDENLNRRTCVTDKSCQVLRLRNRDVEPPTCPEGWEESSFGSTDIREQMRVCYTCLQ